MTAKKTPPQTSDTLVAIARGATDKLAKSSAAARYRLFRLLLDCAETWTEQLHELDELKEKNKRLRRMLTAAREEAGV